MEFTHDGGVLWKFNVLRIFFTFLTIPLSGSFDVKYDNRSSSIGMYSFNSMNFLSSGDMVILDSFFGFSSFEDFSPSSLSERNAVWQAELRNKDIMYKKLCENNLLMSSY